MTLTNYNISPSSYEPATYKGKDLKQLVVRLSTAYWWIQSIREHHPEYDTYTQSSIIFAKNEIREVLRSVDIEVDK
jgi:hypothetical protein